ncbi:hypothetical protein V6Z11_A05G277700 [Gossypium hirsutum]
MMDLFQRTLEECQLVDIGYLGRWFTWERDNLPETNIRERLDRGVTNDEWVFLFLKVKVKHLVHLFSDHYPLLINTSREERCLKNRNFRFEAWWSLDESFLNEVERIWGTSLGNLMEKLENVKKGIGRLGWTDPI